MIIEVIPAINCLNSDCLKERLLVMKNELPNVIWFHIDIADGKFASVKTWNNPNELKLQITNYKLQTNIEVHLMVEKPEEFIDEWLKIGVKRIIVHLETVKNREGEFSKILEKCSEYDVELMIALNPETPIEELFPYLDSLLFVQLLAVKPGFSGQKFDKVILEKIRVLRERLPDIIIEVDGGINPETAKLVKESGADIIVSGYYIFENKSPKKAYQNLVEAVSFRAV